MGWLISLLQSLPPVPVATGLLLLLAAAFAIAATGRRRLAIALLGSLGCTAAAGATALTVAVVGGEALAAGAGDGGIGLLVPLWLAAMFAPLAAMVLTIVALGRLVPWRSVATRREPRSSALATIATACFLLAVLVPPAWTVHRAFRAPEENVAQWGVPRLVAFLEEALDRQPGTAPNDLRPRVVQALEALAASGDPAGHEALVGMLRRRRLSLNLTGEIAAHVTRTSGREVALEILWDKVGNGHDYGARVDALEAIGPLATGESVLLVLAAIEDPDLRSHRAELLGMLIAIDDRIAPGGDDRAWDAFRQSLVTVDAQVLGVRVLPRCTSGTRQARTPEVLELLAPLLHHAEAGLRNEACWRIGECLHVQTAPCRLPSGPEWEAMVATLETSLAREGVR